LVGGLFLVLPAVLRTETLKLLDIIELIGSAYTFLPLLFPSELGVLGFLAVEVFSADSVYL